MRLIDADLLIKYIPPEEYGSIVAVKCCPTAYDVDKVCEELLVKSQRYDRMFDESIDLYYLGKSHAYDDAIEIVKRGGIDEKTRNNCI